MALNDLLEYWNQTPENNAEKCPTTPRNDAGKVITPKENKKAATGKPARKIGEKNQALKAEILKDLQEGRPISKVLERSLLCLSFFDADIKFYEECC
jgi:hypothetical protein